jgi:hypothetical protein
MAPERTPGPPAARLGARTGQPASWLGTLTGRPASWLAAPTILAVLAAACGAGEPAQELDGAGAAVVAGAVDVAAPPAAVEVASPAPVGSGEPNLAAGPDGVWLSWLERRDGGRHALRLSRWDGTSWSDPLDVMERGGLFVNWADFPASVSLGDGTLAAHWLERSGGGTYEYDVRLAISRDGGASWSEDVVPHYRSGVHAEHGFVSLFPADGGIGVVWLDGRETVRGEPMTLRFTTVTAAGEPGPEVLLDDSVCDCCQTSVAAAGDVLVVAYRGRTPGEVRDILVTRRVDGAWTAPRAVHDDGWVIAACPVNGPAVAADGDRVIAAWFTAAGRGEEGQVLAAFSHDAGATFGPPVRVDQGRGMGRVGAVMLEGGEALVTWLERSDDAAEIRLRRVAPGPAGRAVPGPPATLAPTAAARASGFPVVARRGDDVVFAWTEAGETPTVRTAVARLDDGDDGGGE